MSDSCAEVDGSMYYVKIYEKQMYYMNIYIYIYIYVSTCYYVFMYFHMFFSSCNYKVLRLLDGSLSSYQAGFSNLNFFLDLFVKFWSEFCERCFWVFRPKGGFL